jgi:hypothetical protein
LVVDIHGATMTEATYPPVALVRVLKNAAGGRLGGGRAQRDRGRYGLGDRLLFARDAVGKGDQSGEVVEAEVDAVLSQFGITHAAESTARRYRRHFVVQGGPGYAPASITETDEFERLVVGGDGYCDGIRGSLGGLRKC